MITIRFWGVRGSCATAGSHTAQVGGNTSCVEVNVNDQLFILDAGTGLRALGARLMAEGRPVDATILLSHFHWDHIQGFPFFVPAFVPGNRVHLFGPERAAPRGDVRAALDAQMRAPHFPVGLEAMRAELRFTALPAGALFQIGAATVRTAAASHPNGCLAYRISAGGRSVVYATDTEHDASSGLVDAHLLELSRGADLLIYDAQYTDEEYLGVGAPGRRGWGHSTAAEGIRLARAAGIGRLVLFHHDPSHDDWQIARMEADARSLLPTTCAAREGQVITLPPSENKLQPRAA